MNDALIDRLPPYNKNAECGVLGGIMRDPETLFDVNEIIRVEDFYFDAHRKVFQAIADLVAEHLPIDLVLILERLSNNKQLEDVGGAQFLAELWESVQTGANVAYHARIVRDASLVRNLIHVGTEILRDAYERTQSAEELISQAERKIFDISDSAKPKKFDTVTAIETTRAAMERVDSRIAGAPQEGLETGFADLDEVMGPLRCGELTVLGGRPASGKTSLAVCIASNVAAAGTAVLLFSMEMPHEQIGERLLAMGSGVPLNRIRRSRKFEPDETRRMSQVIEPGRIGHYPIFIDDTTDQPASRLLAVTRREIRRHKIGLVLVDYLQLMRPENPKENRTNQVGMMARRLQQLARVCNIPVIALCQLNRQVEGRAGHKPTLADLRDSGEIEQSANVALLLGVKDDQGQNEDVWNIDVVIAKNRNGPTGTVTLAYRRSVVRFENAVRGL